MLLTAAQEGIISLERVVGATSTRPAELFRLGGKGRVAVGRDADLVLVDPTAQHEITDDEVLSKIGWTPYKGHRLSTVVRRTLVRGATVFADGQVTGAPGHGRQAVAGIGEPVLQDR